MFPELPRGCTLPITCEYRFSYAKRVADPADLPDDAWSAEWISSEDDEAEEAGFTFAPVYVVDEGDRASLSFDPEEGQAVAYLFLRNPEGKLVATWDEGRWWTPEESAAFRLFMQVPSTYIFAEGVRQSALPRWARRRKKK